MMKNFGKKEKKEKKQFFDYKSFSKKMEDLRGDNMACKGKEKENKFFFK